MDEQNELTPAQSEAVRRLLAGARDDEGIPDDVAARLEAVLADLSAERAASPVSREAEVIPLHQRRWPKVLVAAAAVTAFGFGIAQLVGNSANDADSGNASTSSGGDTLTAESPDSAQEYAPNVPNPAASPRDNSAVDGARLQLLSQASLNMIGIQGLRQLDPGTLDEDLKELTRATAAEGTNGSNHYDANAARISCGPFYTVVGGETFAASYRRHLALVLFHPKLDGVRLVEIYDCEGRAPRHAVKTVTLQTGE